MELKFDHNSNSQMSQWFYFKVSNTKKRSVYRFNIVNLVKPDSLYNHGMKPVIYSKKEAEYKNLGWHRDGSDITYYASKKKINTPT